MTFTENELYAALGLEAPTGQEDGGAGENTTGVAAGARAESQQDGTPAGAPAGSGNEDGGGDNDNGNEPDGQGEDSPEGDGEGTGSQGGKPAMSREERARNAAARRKAEMDAAVRQAVQQATAEAEARHQAQMQLFFSSANLKDPVTGKPITSMEEYNAFLQGQQQRRIEENLRKGRLPLEDLNALIQAQLAGQQRAAGQDGAGQGAETKAGAGQAQRQAQRGADVSEEQIAAELAEIHKLDHSISEDPKKALEDILRSETGAAFAAEVKRGASFLSAFKLANFDRLRQQSQEESAQRARQAERNSQRSKDHLRTSSATGSGSVPVPAEELAMYHRLMPKATDAEIQAHYNKFLKETKK